MSTLNDIDHEWGADLSVSNSGDLQSVSGTIRGQQRIIRRLLTNPGGYLFHANTRTGDVYGGGLPKYIGSLINVAEMTALIRAQIALEAVIAKSPAPIVVVTQNSNDVSQFAVSINYTDAATKTPVVLAFKVSDQS